MGIRLKGNLANNNEANKLDGFSLTFTNGITYDLDKIIANKDMTNANAPLVIEVKNNRAIAETVAKKLSISVESNIASLDSDALQSKVAEILNSAMEKYSVTDITSAYFTGFVLAYANSELNRYMKSYIGDGISFKISILKYEKTIDVTYNFESEKYFEKALAAAYARYKNQLGDVSVGGLAITDGKTGNINVTSDDYKKYLLSGGAYSNSAKVPGVRKPLVIWSEGSDDETIDSSDTTIPDQIDELKAKIEVLSSLIGLPDTPVGDDGRYIPGKYVLRAIVSDTGAVSYLWGSEDGLIEKHTTIELDENNNGSILISPSVAQYTSHLLDKYFDLVIGGVKYQKIDNSLYYNLVEEA